MVTADPASTIGIPQICVVSVTRRGGPLRWFTMVIPFALSSVVVSSLAARAGRARCSRQVGFDRYVVDRLLVEPLRVDHE